jgi:hypothetical protein
MFTSNLVPFQEDGAIDEDELRRMVNWLVEKASGNLITQVWPDSLIQCLPMLRRNPVRYPAR